MKSARELIREVCRTFAPPPDLTASQWADKYFFLSPEYSAEHGKWTTLPYQRDPLDSISDPRVRRTVIRGGRQMIKTLAVMIAVGYYSHQDPCPILVVQPGQDDAESFSKERIAPMIRDVPVLSGLYSEAKSRSSGNTIGQKLFPGGSLSIVHAGSPRTVARRTIRILCFDEEDKYKPTSEGNVISIGRHCLTTFRHRAKEINTCTPTVAGSNIDRAYSESDQREFYVPCHACGEKQAMTGKFYKQVRWDSSLPTREEQAASASYHCEFCDAAWNDAQRMDAVERGEWRASKPFNGIAGFWISHLYSPWRSLSDIVLEFLTKKDDTQELQTFVNCTLAENWEEPGEQLEWETLVERKERYDPGTVPADGLFLTCGVDVQREEGGRLEAEVVAHGENRETWSVCHKVFYGDPTQQAVWDQLEELRASVFPHELGGELPIERMFVDSGDGTVTASVYEWVARQPRPQVWAIKGDKRSDQPVGPPKSVETSWQGNKKKYGICFRQVDVDFFKSQLYADLRKRRPTEEEMVGGLQFPQGYCHFPTGEGYGDEYFKQLCSEQLVRRKNKRGRVVAGWEQTRTRNEALDMRVYAMAAAWDVGAHSFQKVHYDRLRQRLEQIARAKRRPQTQEQVAPQPQQQTTFRPVIGRLRI